MGISKSIPTLSCKLTSYMNVNLLSTAEGLEPHQLLMDTDGDGNVILYHSSGFCRRVAWLPSLVQCDRTTSKMRGLSPKIISGDSRQSENAQTHTHKHTVPNMKFKLKLLQIKCYVLGFTKHKVQNVLQKIIRVFAEAFVSHDRHTLFALEESGPPRTTYTCESQ
jgi:hypothetical protein